MRVAWLLSVLVACSPRPRQIASIELEPCHLAGAGKPAECGWLEVAAERGRAESGRLRLRVVRIAALARRSAAEPLFLLAGGPGQAASEAFAPMLPVLSSLAPGRDLVMVDQRGTGGSEPLDCELPGSLADGFRDGLLREIAARCAARLSGRSLAPYSTVAAADDIDAVREALGYQRIDLLAVSYGTRLALTYAARHPERARLLILDGVVPADTAIGATAAASAQRALDGVIDACAADAACARAYPDLRSRLDAHLARLEQSPVDVEVADPRSGEPSKVTLTRDGFAAGLRSLLHAPELASLLPLTVAEAEADRYQPFVAQASLTGGALQENLSLGLYLTIACAEDVPRFPSSAERDAGETFVGASLLREVRRACEVWPVTARALDADTSAPIAAPALLLSGELDPATPPSEAEKALASLADARHVVVPDGGHGVTLRGCVPGIVREVIETGQVEGVDSSCVRDHSRPPFFIDLAGPSP